MISFMFSICAHRLPHSCTFRIIYVRANIRASSSFSRSRCEAQNERIQQNNEITLNAWYPTLACSVFRCICCRFLFSGYFRCSVNSHNRQRPASQPARRCQLVIFNLIWFLNRHLRELFVYLFEIINGIRPKPIRIRPVYAKCTNWILMIWWSGDASAQPHSIIALSNRQFYRTINWMKNSKMCTNVCLSSPFRFVHESPACLTRKTQ